MRQCIDTLSLGTSRLPRVWAAGLRINLFSLLLSSPLPFLPTLFLLFKKEPCDANESAVSCPHISEIPPFCYIADVGLGRFCRSLDHPMMGLGSLWVALYPPPTRPPEPALLGLPVIRRTLAAAA